MTSLGPAAVEGAVPVLVPPVPLPDGLSLVTEETIDAVGAAAWNGLAAGRGLYLGYAWMRAAERQTSAEARYVIARDCRGRVRGVCPTYLSREGGTSLYNAFDRFLRPAGIPDDERAAWFPAMTVGSRAGYSTEFLIADASDRAAVLAALLAAAVHEARARDARTVDFLYLRDSAVADLVPLLDARHRAFLAGADCVIRVEWSSVEEYVLAQPRRRRPPIRRELREFEGAGYTVEIGTLGPVVDEAAALLARLQKRYGHADTADDMRRYLASQAEALDPASVVFLLRRGGRLVGFALFYAVEGVLYGRAAGFEYEALDGRFEYFNLSVYLPLRYAIEHGFRELRLGPGSYEAKALRGAELEPLWGVVVPLVAAPLGEREEFLRWRDAELAAWRPLLARSPSRDALPR
jgi:predicted N-acyltransferase